MEDLKEKIAKLLKKAESTDNEHEAKTFSEAAERLMLKWGIEAAELEAVGKVVREDIIEIRRTYTGSHAMAWIAFGGNIASGFGLRTLQANMSKYTSGDQRILFIVGHKTDIEHCEMLLTSLEIQSKAAIKRWQLTDVLYQSLNRGERHRASRQFHISFSWAVRNRITELFKEEAVGVSSGAELVLVDKKQRVNDWMDEHYKNLRSVKNRSMGAVYGARAGQQAGLEATLASGAIGDKREAIG